MMTLSMAVIMMMMLMTMMMTIVAHVHGLTGWRKLCRKRIAARGNLPPGAVRQKSKLDGEGLI